MVRLLQEMIRIPSFSKEENGTADLLEQFLTQQGISVDRVSHNIIARNRSFDIRKPSILLNSHHDTVRPNEGWTRDPYDAEIKDGRLFGLGSNDAGASVVSMMGAFGSLQQDKENPYNLILVLSAEEEISGKNGIELILPGLDQVAFGIVGEPTGLQMAMAEKGLMVLDCLVQGISGHAARDEGVNALYKALPDIEWFRDHRFEKRSKLLGEVKMTVSMLKSGIQHNVVPDRCEFVVDVRSTDVYSNEELLGEIRQHVACEVRPRSTRLQPSSISEDHILLTVAKSLGINLFGSSTMSDQALMRFPTVKIGPGESSRSHSSDEFVYIEEIHSGIDLYINLITEIMKRQQSFDIKN